jgi:hypothetical protein
VLPSAFLLLLGAITRTVPAGVLRLTVVILQNTTSVVVIRSLWVLMATPTP